MKKLVFVKLGGSLITDKKKIKSERIGVIRRLCSELVRYQIKSGKKIIIGNGGGSYSHPVSKEYDLEQGFKDKNSLIGIARVQDLGSQLNRIIVQELINKGLPAVSINPSSCMITENSEISSMYIKPLLTALNLGIVPVVYGDIIFDTLVGCSDISTEKVFNYLIKNLKKDFIIEKVVYCGSTDGVYDAKGRTIPKLTLDNITEFLHGIGLSEGIDVTGGMLHKVEQALKLSDVGVSSIIINGNKHENLYNSLTGKAFSGTLIAPIGRKKLKYFEKSVFLTADRFLQDEFEESD